jgi:uncharacterized membrane protein
MLAKILSNVVIIALFIAVVGLIVGFSFGAGGLGAAIVAIIIAMLALLRLMWKIRRLTRLLMMTTTSFSKSRLVQIIHFIS